MKVAVKQQVILLSRQLCSYQSSFSNPDRVISCPLKSWNAGQNFRVLDAREASCPHAGQITPHHRRGAAALVPHPVLLSTPTSPKFKIPLCKFHGQVSNVV